MTRRYIRGDLKTRLEARLSPIERVPGMSPCLEWQGFRDRKGYGRIDIDGKPFLAHRAALKILGRLDKRPVMHLCDNPPCCNPDHLRSGSLAENNADMFDKNRHARGDMVSSAKLSEGQAERIISRHQMGEPIAKIARDFAVSYEAVYACAKGDTWRHLHDDSPPSRGRRMSSLDREFMRIAKQKRLELDMAAVELSRRLGGLGIALPRVAITKMELGERVLGFGEAVAIAQVLGLDISVLAGGR